MFLSVKGSMKTTMIFNRINTFMSHGPLEINIKIKVFNKYMHP